MEAHTAMKARLIGAVLVDKGLITGEQLDVALDLQAKTGERLGEIVVAEFGVPRLELASVLAEQWAELDSVKLEAASTPVQAREVVEPLTPDEVQIRRPIGEIFVELGFIDSNQLESALKAQGESGARIGEILVEQGSLSRLDLASALAEQWSALQKLRPPSPIVDPQPWQNGVPPTPAGEAVLSAADRATVTALEERLRLVESAAATSLTQEDLNRVQIELRAALGAVEARIEAGRESTDDAELAETLGALIVRIDALEASSTSTELAELRQEIEALKAQPSSSDLLTDLNAAVERLEQRPDTAEELEGLAAEIVVLTKRLDELAAIGELSERLDTTAQAESELTEQIASLSARLERLSERVEDYVNAPAEDLSPRIAELVARVDDVAAAMPTTHNDDLGARIESLEEKGSEGSEALERLASELEELGSRTQQKLDALAALHGESAPVDEWRGRLDELATAVERASDATLVEELRVRIEQLAASVASKPDAAPIDDLRARVTALTDQRDSVGSLEARLGELEARIAEATPAAELREEMARRFETLGSLEPSIADVRALVADVDALRVADALATGSRLGGVEAAVESLAARTPTDELGDRISELAERIEQVPGDARDSVGGLVEELRARIDGVADGLGARVDELTGRDGSIGSLRSELVEQTRALDSRLQAHNAELVALRARVGELQEDRATGEAFEARLEAMLEERLDTLSTRITEEVGAARADAEQKTAAVHAEAGSLGSRIDEVLGLRHADLHAARAADEQLAEQLEILTGLREEDVQAARAAEADLSVGLERLARSLHEDTAAARATAEGVGTQLGQLQRSRAEDLAAADAAGAELAARLDEVALRSAASTADVEHALRAEIGSLSARFEENDAASIEAREELRGELERLASSMGWRLEKIEESLADDDSAVLRATVAELERRLGEQSALGEERVRATERALRKGLASLGERLLDSESAYVEAGNTLRRSIERLGAAVVEADARMADQIPASPLEGCVAFAPTADGYRLIELPGTPPEIGATIELEKSGGSLVVTRYGRSPLPFDGRPCAYLDRA